MGSTSALIVWNDDYSVQIQEFDVQHQRLISLLNELHQAMLEGKNKVLVSRILNDLVDSTRRHFAAEERRMQEAAYPDFLSHKMEHYKLKHQVTDFLEEFDAGDGAISVQMMDFLKDWLVRHINGADKKYTPHLRAHAGL